MKKCAELEIRNYGRRVYIPAPLRTSNISSTGILHSDFSRTVVYPFDEKLISILQLFSLENKMTLFLTLLEAFRVLLYRSDNHEKIWAVNFAGNHGMRHSAVIDPETEGQTGFYTSLDRIKSSLQAANKNLSGTTSGSAHNKPNCRVKFMMVDTDGLSDMTAFEADDKQQFDLTFIMIDSAAPQIMIRFNANLHAPDIIEQMIAHYKQLLYSIVKEPDQKIGELSMLSAAEQTELLRMFNDTERPYPADTTIVDTFEQQVIKGPDSIALYMGDRTMTYDKLNQKANQLARYLLAQGVTSGDNVGLLANRGFDMIAGLFAVLKCGAAYVPISPDYPEERQRYMVKQSSVKFILSDVDHSLNKAAEGIKAIDMRTVPYNKYGSDNLSIPIDSRQLAYTIYTSGSTGVPKGVMIEHHSVINLITWVNTEFNIGPDDRLLFITSIGFDLSVYDIFGILSAGGSLIIASREDMMNVTRLATLMQRFRVTFWDSVPSTLDHLISRLTALDSGYRQEYLRLAFLSGDWIPVGLPGKIGNFFPNAKVISLGGATEGTVWSNYYPIGKVGSGWHSIPYGKPITNNTFYVLNEEQQPAPYGDIGELYIGGVGVARGYANDPGKTGYAFLDDPFTSRPQGKMYRTGDLGRMLPDGNMEFIGRVDNQVKLRGHRVELGEIESVIRQHETVSNAVVLFSRDKKQLISYIVPEKFYDREKVIAYLKEKLPDYMIPYKWVELERIPLTENGKTDTRALHNIDALEQLKSEFVAPQTELEKSLVAIWKQVLGASSAVGIHDNFFDLGGQSLISLELIAEMKRVIGKELPVNILYKYPTIAQLVAFIQQEGSTVKKWKSLVAIKPGTKMPVYIVHGDGVSLSKFHALADYVDRDQPVFGLEPKGLNGLDEPLTNFTDIAKHYIAEILEHNPNGPYALAGYSFGGYVAVEMKKELELLGKKVKMLAVFDTDAENVHYKKSWMSTLPKRLKRQIPKFFFIARSMVTRPRITFNYQYSIFSSKINALCYKLGIKKPPELTGVNKNISKVNATHSKAFREFHMMPFNDKIHLFKARSRVYFVDDRKYLGWSKFALDGVVVHDIPGDHSTMFLPPNVNEMGRLLQYALDNC